MPDAVSCNACFLTYPKNIPNCPRCKAPTPDATGTNEELSAHNLKEASRAFSDLQTQGESPGDDEPVDGDDATASQASSSTGPAQTSKMNKQGVNQ